MKNLFAVTFTNGPNNTTTAALEIVTRQIR
jgi:hypothetical protein